MTPDLQQLHDRAEITDLVYRLGACLDEGRPDDLHELLADDVTVSTPGGQAAGREAVVAQAFRNHPEDQGFQHVTTNVLVDVAGDRASVRANLVVHITVADDLAGAAAGGPPAPPPRCSIGEVYRFELVRTPGGWRFSRIATTPLWLSGTVPAPTRAA